MKNKFCILNEDDKTYNIFLRYNNCLDNNIDLFKEDNKIQAEEILIHRYCCGRDGYDWTENNAEKERIYLNTIKILVYTVRENHLEPTKENCNKCIREINSNYELLQTILCKIY